MSSFEQLRQEVCEANVALGASGLVVLTWGNASGVDRDAGVMGIKPSGVAYANLTADDIVVVSIESGGIVAGAGRPSSDAPTHLLLYREFPDIGGVVHTHSSFATSFAQAMRPIPCFGTTHADHFYGEIPVTRPMLPEEINGEYEANTGKVIIERLRETGMAARDMPGILTASHGPFTWGKTAAQALENAIAIEALAHMALNTILLQPDIPPVPGVLLDKHFLRKHGANAYYGQGN